MKRKRADSTPEPAGPRTRSSRPADKRLTNGSRSHAQTPTATPKRQRKSQPVDPEDLSDDELATAPITPSKSTRKSISSPVQQSRPRGLPKKRQTKDFDDTIAVEKTTKKRGPVSHTIKRNSSRPQTPERPCPPSPQPEPRKESQKKNVKDDAPSEPATKTKEDEDDTTATSQRRATRGSMRRQLNLALDDEDVEDEEIEEEDEEDDDDEEDQEGVGHEIAKTVTSYESFFHHATQKKKSLTTDNSLSLLPTLTLQESNELLAGIPETHAKEIENLQAAHRQQFTQWKFEVDNGYNILLFGYGSKRTLMETFATEELAEEMAVVVLNGYFPTLSPDLVLSEILQHIGAPTTGDNLALVATHLREPLAIIVHSLDSPVLRQPKNQQILSTLAANKYITMVASVDHVNAPLLFDSLKSSRYNFLWHDATTFVPYKHELSFETATFLSGTANATAAVGGLPGIKAVLNNLTSNARTLYLLVLQHQYPLQEGMEPASQDHGVTFSQLRELCAKKILPLANPTTLRNVLQEFFDHGLIVRNDGRGNTGARKGRGGGGEILWAPFGRVVVREVIEFLGGEVEEQ